VTVDSAGLWEDFDELLATTSWEHLRIVILPCGANYSVGDIITAEVKLMVKYALLSLGVAGLLMLGEGLAPQVTWPTGQQERFVVRVPEDFPTIQTAIDAVAEGGTVLIGPGLYKENVQIKKSLRLVGLDQKHVNIQAADERQPIIFVSSKSPIQVYFEGLTLGDPTITIEQLLLTPHIQPVLQPFLPPRTGLYIDGPVQTLIRNITVLGQQEVGIWAHFFAYSDGDIHLSTFQPLIILEGVHLTRNGAGLGLTGAQGLIIRSLIEDNLGGVLGEGAFLYQNIIRSNRYFGIVFLDLLAGEIDENEFIENKIGIYLTAKSEGRWIEINWNKFMKNQYGVVVQHPACPYFTGDALPEPLKASLPIRISGAMNEFYGSIKADLCPTDYPWPPGFRK
jgi:hypothetical protein